MDRIFSHRFFIPASFILITVVVFAAYSGGMHTPFQFDGVPQILKNRLIRDLGDLGAIFGSNRPVTVLTFALNYAFGGLDTFGYHVVNVFLHAINAILAFLLVTVVLGSCGLENARARRVGFFTALIFAVHPIQTQAVVYIIQRMELLGSFFYLAAMLLFALGAGLSESNRSNMSWTCYALVVLAFVIGFYSKEVVITLPAAILLFDVLFISRLRIGPMARRAPLYVVLAVLMCLFAYSTISGGSGFSDVSSESIVAGAPAAPAASGPQAPGGGGRAADNGATAGPELPRVAKGPSAGFGVESMTPGEYLMTQFNVLTYYMTMLVYPANQNVDYDFQVSTSLFKAPPTPPGTALNYPQPPPVVSLAVLLAIIACAVWLVMRELKRGHAEGGRYGPGPAIAFFILWFFIILAPTSSVVPIYDVITEHRLYLPSLGFIAIALVLLDMGIAKVLGGAAK